MRKNKFISINLASLRFLVAIITALILCAHTSFSQDSYAYRKGRVKHRLGVGLVKSFYKNHPEHTTNTKAKFGYSASYKAEIFFDRRANIMIGLEYLNQGLSFKGYY